MSSRKDRNKTSHSGKGQLEESHSASLLLEGTSKRLLYSGSSAILPFLCYVLIVLPIWLVVLLPLLLLWMLLSSPFKICKKKPPLPASFVDAHLGPIPETIRPLHQREFDLVLFGATGFTGELAAKYLAEHYGDGTVKWAICGRSRAKLENLATSLKARYGCSVPVIIADAANVPQLRQVVENTRVLITTVGPYIKYGGPVLGACALLGTSYCDITGETTFVRAMLDKFDELARVTGARIVPHAGNDCIPWDLATLLVWKELKSRGEALSEVHHFDSIRFAPSGGTLETALYNMQAPKYRPRCGFDPLLKPPPGGGDGEAKESKEASAGGAPKALFAARLHGLVPSFSRVCGQWVGQFFLAGVNANCIRRANTLRQYSGAGRLLYHEALVFPNFMAGVIELVHTLVFGTSMAIGPLRWLLRRLVLPAPGEGPSMAQLAQGFLRLDTLGIGHGGSRASVQLFFPGDTGYIGTAQMLVEAGLALALDADQISVGGGFWTPATCQGEVLLERLVRADALQVRKGVL